jgi:uncharacterized membrane protein
MPEANFSSNMPARSPHPGLVVLWLILAAGYLVASAMGFFVVAMVAVGFMVGALLVASGRVTAGCLIGMALVAACIYFSDSMQFIIYAPPLAAFAFMAFFFYRTLRPGSEPLITRVARREHPDLPPDMARYTRTLTWGWSLCFALLFIVGLLLVPLLPLDTWSRTVHGLGYVLPGALFLGEYAYRHYRFRDRSHGSLLALIPNIVAVSREAAMSFEKRDTESMMLPIASFRSPDDAVLLGPEGEISAGAFFARARDLADALPDAPFVINLSESRAGFMLGFAAALVRRQTSLLPSGQGRGDWEQLAEQYPGASIISDREIGTPDVFDLKPYLAMGDASLRPLHIPDVPAGFIAAILFTSGSTGKPTAHAKSWGQLWRGAANTMAALGWTRPVCHAVLGSVPPQHMFGLESTVMLPWHAGIPVHINKPLLPSDIEVALHQCGRPCWWMTTPVHLRPPLQATAVLAELAGIVASTMSLPSALAAAAEAKWQVPVVEIYGSTETGALATRRTATENWWTPLPGVELTEQNDGGVSQIRAAGSHIDVPVLLTDELSFKPDGRFLWLGRAADMLKIGGKRASLLALNQWIAEIPGVDDAVYFVPDASGDATSHDDAHPIRRLAAFYVSSTLAPEQVRAALRARVDPVFMPRPLFRVASLPRNANGKFVHATLAKLFLNMKQADGATPSTTGFSEPPLVVPGSHPALQGHFPGNPIVPGVVILSCVTHDIERQLPHVVLGTLLTMRFHKPLRPEQLFRVHAELRGGKERESERVHVEIREADSQSVPGALIGAGQWACSARANAGESA